MENRAYNEFAVLYRTNSQSRNLEEKFIEYNIPYRIYGGINFYSRKEIKDILAYLKTIDNGRDDLAVRRIGISRDFIPTEHNMKPIYLT